MEVCRFPAFVSTAISYLLEVLDPRIRERTFGIFAGMLLAQDRRRTASKWFRAAGIGAEYKSAYKHVGSVGREAVPIATRVLRTVAGHAAGQAGERVVFAVDDTLSKRSGPLVEGAGIHHNPTPGPAGSELAYGHNFVVLAQVVEHPERGAVALPLRADLYVRKTDGPKLPAWYKFRFKTKLQLAAEQLEWLKTWQLEGEKPVWIAADGGYAKKAFIDACRKHGFTLVSRLRRDAALCDVPEPPRAKGRGRPRKYGAKRIDLAKRAAHGKGWTTETMVLYGKEVTKTYKTFLATWRPAGGVIRVVLVKEDDGSWVAFFCTDPEAAPAEVLGTVADRNSLEQAFKDAKEIRGAGQQQLRNLHANLGAFSMNLWMMTLTELWAWDRPERELVDRADRPWDNKPRRPSHNDKRKSLIRMVLREELNRLPRRGPGSRLFRRACETLFGLAF